MPRTDLRPLALPLLALPGAAVAPGCARQVDRFDACAELNRAPPSPPPEGGGGIIYEVYVRSFQDSDGDGIGDLPGLTGRLSYLQWLGVETLWLMPVHDARGPAGYDVRDYRSVHVDYGSHDDLRSLFEQAAARGIQVILDAPINHTGLGHPWFTEALADPRSEQRARYQFSHRRWDDQRWFSAGQDDWYYGYFGRGFPDLDWSNPDVVHDMADMLQGWLDEGAAGFRLDAVRQLVEDDQSISDTAAGHCTLGWLLAELSQDQDPLIVAEAWAEDVDLTVAYLGRERRPQADLVTSVSRLLTIQGAFDRGDADILAELVRSEAALEAEQRISSVIGTHDLRRFRSRVPDPALRRAWMVLHLTLPGAPVLYYGEELDLRDSKESTGQDHPWRAPMAWSADAWGGFTTGTPWMEPSSEYLDGVNVADAAQDSDSMLRLVHGLIQLRRGTEALRQGPLELLETTQPPLFAFERTWGDDAVLVAVNLSGRDLGEDTLPRLSERAWFDLSSGLPAPDQARLDLPPYGYRVLVTEGLAGHSVPGPVEGEESGGGEGHRLSLPR